MTPQEIALLRETFDRLRPISESAAALFYGRLFEIAPEVRALFKSDMKEQGRKLMATLASMMNGIDEMHVMRPAVENLGRRHFGYGVSAEHFPPVGEALLWTMEQGLGPAFTPEMRQAWQRAYVMLAGVMLETGPRSASA